MVVKATTRVRNALALLKSAENALQAADFSSDPMPREIVEVIEQVRDQVASLLTLAAARERPSGIHPKILGLAKSTSSAAQRVRSAG